MNCRSPPGSTFPLHRPLQQLVDELCFCSGMEIYHPCISVAKQSLWWTPWLQLQRKLLLKAQPFCVCVFGFFFCFFAVVEPLGAYCDHSQLGAWSISWILCKQKMKRSALFVGIAKVRRACVCVWMGVSVRTCVRGRLRLHQTLSSWSLFDNGHSRQWMAESLSAVPVV